MVVFFEGPQQCCALGVQMCVVRVNFDWLRLGSVRFVTRGVARALRSTAWNCGDSCPDVTGCGIARYVFVAIIGLCERLHRGRTSDPGTTAHSWCLLSPSLT